MNIVRKLVREEIARLLQDDALFNTQDIAGIVNSSEIQNPSSCSVCGTKHKGPCHNPAWDKKSSYMAKPQLYRIIKNSTEIFNMLEDDQEIEDWMESYIAQAENMIGSVYKKFEYKNSPSYSKKYNIFQIIKLSCTI